MSITVGVSLDVVPAMEPAARYCDDDEARASFVPGHRWR
jgi:hypothetical protein